MQETQEMWVWSLRWEESLEEETATHSQPGKFHGLRSVAGYSPKGHKELDMTDPLSQIEWIGKVSVEYKNFVLLNV